jgi:aryl-alcohol dehydrogenase-like predicted oxidoreductase
LHLPGFNSALSLAWLLAKTIITAPIIGANSVAQLQHSFAALDVTLPTAQLAQLDEVSGWQEA